MSEHNDHGSRTCSRCLFWDWRRDPSGDLECDPCSWDDTKFRDGFEDAGFCKLAANDLGLEERIRELGSPDVRARAYGHEGAEAGLLTMPGFGCNCFRDRETGDDPEPSSEG